ncbi:UNVERIFIED_ORG: Ca2+-binding RTX toxin-like protein [Rhizobium sophorae]|uniref:family 16 glycosylhydrolase n=1 Tax=Rhizobium leguminosarum TaxID=384 RepID=UPI0013B013F5|nr:family 16 glycosylhydrolase [Rhizobium leguminosarum]MBB4526530.1 Ca2+-binding RTX toxin-like protein [Rhizobium leguminosarum]MDH6663655.1 Ca2+-binding RTX toxin-like protein [Rhizobium sophorae]
MALDEITWTNQYAGTSLNLSTYNISFQDEFNTLSVAADGSTQATWYSGVHSPFGVASFTSGATPYNPFSVDEGALHIKMQQVDGQWQSGILQSVNASGLGFAQSYGYFEIKAAFPSGIGAWPAFWLLSEGGEAKPRVEVDVVEAYAADPDGHHTTLHFRPGTNTPDVTEHEWASDYTGMPTSLFDSGYHTYGTMITPDWIITYMDGVELARTAANKYTSGPYYMLVDLAMTTSAGADPTQVYDMQIDYVRAYADPRYTAQYVIGTSGADFLNGTPFNDKLDGREGADRMSGGNGDDTYYVDDVHDLVYEIYNAGTDQVISSVSFDMRGQYIEKLTLTGTADLDAIGTKYDNTILGNSGNNSINGGAGADWMAGGAGNDTYFVDSTKDQVIERAGEGIDTVHTTISLDIRGQYLEAVVVDGNAAASIVGNSLDNTIVGNQAANTIDGSFGADVMIGGCGDDVYYIDNRGDIVVESVSAGTDTIYTTIGISTPIANVEVYRLLGAENLGLKASDGDQKLFGNVGNNTLDGGAGVDWLEGGKGNDIYYVDQGDVVIERQNEGTDMVYSSASFSLAGQYLEKLILTGSGNIDGRGNGYDNTINGNAGNNILCGGGGSDILRGGFGNDILVGDENGTNYSDTFVFDQTPSLTNVDTVLDFRSGSDKIQLAAGVFKGLAGSWSENSFDIGSGSTHPAASVVYDDTTGKLYYDPDGSGSIAQVQFAELTGGPNLTWQDFILV